jgi:hypothetical protein
MHLYVPLAIETARSEWLALLKPLQLEEYVDKFMKNDCSLAELKGNIAEILSLSQLLIV